MESTLVSRVVNVAHSNVSEEMKVLCKQRSGASESDEMTSLVVYRFGRDYFENLHSLRLTAVGKDCGEEDLQPQVHVGTANQQEDELVSQTTSTSDHHNGISLVESCSRRASLR